MLKEKRLSILLYSAGLVLIFFEVILRLFEKSICQTEGCRVVESFVKGGDIVLLLIGICVFTTLLLLSFVKKYDFLHSLILIAAMAAEGYLLAFQVFVIKEFCIFCLVVFTILLLSSFLRFMMGYRELVFAFVSFVSLFLVTYLVNPRIFAFPLAKQSCVLIYSKDCPHCEEVIKFSEQMSTSIHKIETTEIPGLIKALNLKSVPVLYCNEGLEKKFILGAENIKRYLLTKNTLRQDIPYTSEKAHVSKKPNKPQKGALREKPSANDTNREEKQGSFSLTDMSQPKPDMNQPEENGMCSIFKSSEKTDCKN